MSLGLHVYRIFCALMTVMIIIEIYIKCTRVVIIVQENDFGAEDTEN